MSRLSLDKSTNFALRIIKLYKYLTAEKQEYVLAKQILRSGTSIGANLTESEHAISKKRFFSKSSYCIQRMCRNSILAKSITQIRLYKFRTI